MTLLLKSLRNKVILSIFIIFVIIFAVPIIPISYHEPYEVQVEVTKTNTVTEHTFTLGSVTLTSYDFIMPSSQTVNISWTSSKDVTMFGVMKEETYNSLKNALIMNLGLPIVLALLSGGLLTPVLIASIPPIIIATLHSIASTEYYKMSDSSDITTKNLDADSYKLVVVSFGSSGTLNAKVTYDYKVMETQTKYRTIRKTITPWAYLMESY